MEGFLKDFEGFSGFLKRILAGFLDFEGFLKDFEGFSGFLNDYFRISSIKIIFEGFFEGFLGFSGDFSKDSLRIS